MGSEDVEMEVDDGGQTPRKPKQSKRPVVVSPSTDDQRSRRQRVGSVSRSREESPEVAPDPVSPSLMKRLRTLISGQGACGPCQKYRVECVPQPNPKKTALACNYCTVRKLKCDPLSSWAQAIQDAQVAKPKKRTVIGAYSFPIPFLY